MSTRSGTEQAFTQTCDGSLTVIPAFDESAVTFQDCSISPRVVTTEESATVSITVHNGNDVAALVELRGSIGGSSFGSASGEIPGGDSRSFELRISPRDIPGAGEFDPSVQFTARDRAPSPATASARVAGVDRGTAATALAGLGVAGVTALAR